MSDTLLLTFLLMVWMIGRCLSRVRYLSRCWIHIEILVEYFTGTELHVAEQDGTDFYVFAKGYYMMGEDNLELMDIANETK